MGVLARVPCSVFPGKTDQQSKSSQFGWGDAHRGNEATVTALGVSAIMAVSVMTARPPLNSNPLSDILIKGNRAPLNST